MLKLDLLFFSFIVFCPSISVTKGLSSRNVLANVLLFAGMIAGMITALEGLKLIMTHVMPRGDISFS